MNREIQTAGQDGYEMAKQKSKKNRIDRQLEISDSAKLKKINIRFIAVFFYVEGSLNDLLIMERNDAKRRIMKKRNV